MKKNGFTLVELLVVISIIATMLAFLMPNFMGARERAKDAQKIQDMSSLKSALRMYYNDHQAYPTPASGNTLDSSFASYFPAVSGIGYTYSYYQTDNGDGFDLCVNLDSGVGNDDIDSQKKCDINRARCGLLATDPPKDKLYQVCAK